MRITHWNPEDTSAVEQAASILLSCFGRLSSSYLMLEEALTKSFVPDRISRAAIDTLKIWYSKYFDICDRYSSSKLTLKDVLL